MLTGRRYLLALTAEQAAYAETVGSICRAVVRALPHRIDHHTSEGRK